MRHANLNRMSFCIRSKGEVRNVSKNSRHPWFCCEPRASGVSSVFRARRYNVTTRVNATVMHASVGSRVMHASRARPYVPSDSERGRGRDASDPWVALEDEEGDEEDEHDDDDRTLAEVLGDVQARRPIWCSRDGTSPAPRQSCARLRTCVRVHSARRRSTSTSTRPWRRVDATRLCETGVSYLRRNGRRDSGSIFTRPWSARRCEASGVGARRRRATRSQPAREKRNSNGNVADTRARGDTRGHRRRRTPPPAYHS